MHAEKELMKMPLGELEEIAYAVQIEYEPPLREDDRREIVEELLYLIDNMDNLDIDEILERRRVERKRRGIHCNRVSVTTGEDLLNYDDQQLIFYALDSNKYSCYTRFEVEDIISTSVDPYTNKRVSSPVRFLFEQLLREQDYPNILVYGFMTEIDNRLGKYRHDRKYHYDREGKVTKMEQYENGTLKYVRFYQDDRIVDTFYV